MPDSNWTMILTYLKLCRTDTFWVPLMCRWETSGTRTRRTEDYISSELTSSHTHLAVHTLFAVYLCLMHTYTQLFSHLVSSTDQQSRLEPIPWLLTLYTVFVFTLSLCPFLPLALISRSTKNLTVGKGEGMFKLRPCFLWRRHPHFYLCLSCVAAARSQNTLGISISSSLPYFLSRPHLDSVQCGVYYWQESYMKHIAKVSKCYTGKALREATLMNQSRESLWSYNGRGRGGWLMPCQVLRSLGEMLGCSGDCLADRESEDLTRGEKKR